MLHTACNLEIYIYMYIMLNRIIRIQQTDFFKILIIKRFQIMIKYVRQNQ